jgi:hypothetical protein
MCQQVYDPVGDSLGWSTLFAVIPLSPCSSCSVA